MCVISQQLLAYTKFYFKNMIKVGAVTIEISSH